jgi:16S rRNA processing protein RimM
VPDAGGRESKRPVDAPAMAGSGADWDELILVGVVARTHGTSGQVIVNPHTDFVDERFEVGARLDTRLADGTRRVSEVTSYRLHQGRPIIGIAGIASIDEAERLTGAEFKIDPAAQHALPEGQYYHHQLIGCDVVTDDGSRVGRVVAVTGEGQSRLVVDGPQRRLEIPLADEICSVRVPERRIVVRPPEGLLDL